MQIVKIYLTEIIMFFEHFKSTLNSQSVPWVDLQQLINDITCVWIHILGPIDLSGENFVEGSYFSCPFKRHSTRMHPVNNAPERP